LRRVRSRAAELRPGLEQSLARVRTHAGELRPSFDEVVRRTLTMSTRVASRILGDAEAVADVLQDAYLNVYRSLERFRGAARYETWVYRIVVNQARSYLRRVRRQREREAPMVHEDAPQLATRPSEDVERVVEQLDVVELLTGLSPQDQELLMLRYLLGLSVAQVASELGVSENVVKVRLHRARRRLLVIVQERAEREVPVEGKAHRGW
jgi:RNA polymerase sigma-70 factor (ECF subfamily)